MSQVQAGSLKQSFLAAMSRAASTVNVVTTDGVAGRAGLTLSAMVSVSADTEQPTLLICVNENTHSSKRILENGRFCVNVLREDQRHVSDCFAGRGGPAGADKFLMGEWTRCVSGCPRLADALVAFDCDVVWTQQVGTHYMFLGAVHDLHYGSGMPLLYVQRSYATAVMTT
ncbi:flavin reductase family protein [Orrella sp. JC864]|uniref:flavin reductase family protein n=1 Tax=Orrella sp. JC864 TaxID=3120298 RepID=UPI00300B5A20